VERLATLDRHAIRAVFERRFSATVMARNYVRLYQQLLTADAGPELSPVLRPPVADIGNPIFAE
jgi:hypothetical protein